MSANLKNLSHNSDYETTDSNTRALICFKLNKKEEAREYAELAVNLGRKEGKDVSTTLYLLKRLMSNYC